LVFQYLPTQSGGLKNHLLWRALALYHDGRTGLTKTDNRALAVRQADKKNIRIGSYGAE